MGSCASLYDDSDCVALTAPEIESDWGEFPPAEQCQESEVVADLSSASYPLPLRISHGNGDSLASWCPPIPPHTCPPRLAEDDTLQAESTNASSDSNCDRFHLIEFRQWAQLHDDSWRDSRHCSPSQQSSSGEFPSGKDPSRAWPGSQLLQCCPVRQGSSSQVSSCKDPSLHPTFADWSNSATSEENAPFARSITANGHPTFIAC